MRLILVSHTDCFAGEAAIINRLFAEGLEYFHLRKPAVQEEKIRQLLDGIERAYMPRIAIHQYHEMAAAYGIHRLHFTEHHRLATSTHTLKKLHEQQQVLTTSVHNVPVARQLLSIFSYAFFGPVFNSISKEDYHAIVGEDFFWPNEQKAVPMIALGGIDAANIGRVAAMNFDGAAILGAIWKEPSKAIEQFRLCKQNVHL